MILFNSNLSKEDIEEVRRILGKNTKELVTACQEDSSRAKRERQEEKERIAKINRKYFDEENVQHGLSYHKDMEKFGANEEEWDKSDLDTRIILNRELQRLWQKNNDNDRELEGSNSPKKISWLKSWFGKK